jgi:hypothetical protein
MNHLPLLYVYIKGVGGPCPPTPTPTPIPIPSSEAAKTYARARAKHVEAPEAPPVWFPDIFKNFDPAFLRMQI